MLDQETSLTVKNHFRRASVISSNNRLLKSHCFQKNDSESLLSAGHQKHVTTLVQIDELFIAYDTL